MNSDRELDVILAAELVDAGCSAGFEVLHKYVEEELAGRQPARTHPGVAAHLVSCPACRADYLGLVDAARLFGDADPSVP
jgi:predicted anti-sigma-YlaC factor YlaD